MNPRISATALAEYLILHPDGQETVLHDSRFTRTSIVAANAEAKRALRAYNCDPRRDYSALERVKIELRAIASSPETKPKARDEKLRCIEIIDLFLRQENPLGLRSMALRESPKFSPIMIEGVLLSIQPDFLVAGDEGRIGAAILRLAKAPDPSDCKLEETKLRRGDHRREMAAYMVAMLQLLLETEGNRLGVLDKDLCFVADVRLGERIGPARDHTRRLRAIRSACRQIASLWPGITPRPSVLAK